MLRTFCTNMPIFHPSADFDNLLTVSGAPYKMLSTHGLLSFANKLVKMDTALLAEPIAQEIEQCKNLLILELKGNTVGVEAGVRLAAAIQKHPELQRCLWSDMFTGRLKTEIPPILKSMCAAMIRANCQIVELDLSDNAFGPIGAEGISDFLVSPSAFSLEVLKLNNNGLGAGGKIIASCLEKCYDNAKNSGKRFRLKTFIAGRNRLEDPGAIALSRAFKKIGTLEEIIIPQNGIRSKGIIALADALNYNSNLKIINFNDNTCGVDGAKAVASALENLLSLEVLDLGDALCRKGAVDVIEQLTQGDHVHLKKVDLSGSELTGADGRRIMYMWLDIFENEHTVLALSNNCFGSKFAELEDLATDTGVNLGSESDDEGTLSGASDDEEEEEEEEEDEDDDDYEEKYSDAETESDNEDKNKSALDALLQGVGCMKVSETVSFLDQQLKLNSAADAESVCKKINSTSSMGVLELRGNTLGVEAGACIGESLSKHPELKRCLWSDLFTGRLKTEIPPILQVLCKGMMRANCQITELDLSDNAFGPIGAEGIREFLVSPSAYTLEVLKLNNNGLGAGGKIIAECLSTCYDNAKRDGKRFQLKTFIAGRNRLEVPGATALSGAFKKIGTLEEIVVHQNGINPKGIEALASCLTFNTNLKIVNFNDNTATPSGSYAIAKALPHLKKLEVLNLGDCLCRNNGCHAIVDNLSPLVQMNLKEVNLSGAELTADSAINLCGKWKKFRAAKLIIDSNNFGENFEDVETAAKCANIFVGNEDDDQGSLSDDEEKNSEPDSEDENCNDVQVLNSDNATEEYLKSLIEQNTDKFDSATQEAAAKLFLQLACVIQQSKGNSQIFELASDVATKVVEKISNTRKRPIPATTQFINQLAAQLGFVKAEENWGIHPDPAAVHALLFTLGQKGFFTEEQNAINYFFVKR